MSLWLFLALLVPFTIGVVMVLDKLILERYAPTIFFYAFWVGLLELVLGGLLLLGLSFGQLDARAYGGGLLVGAIGSTSFLMLLAALRNGQLARVAPVYYLNPLMVAPMSIVFLDEEVAGVIWVAITMAVVGAALVSWEGAEGGRWAQPRAQGFALLGAFLFALSNVVSKHFFDLVLPGSGTSLDRAEFWQLYAGSRTGFGMLVFVALATRDVRRRGRRMIGDGKFIGLVALAEVVVSGAILAMLGAISLGPVSRVSAIGALGPAVVLLYSVALARMVPSTFGGWVTLRNLPTQVAGIGTITAAVVIISLEG